MTSVRRLRLPATLIAGGILALPVVAAVPALASASPNSLNVVQDNDPAVNLAAWAGTFDAHASGGTYRQNNVTGGTASMKFSGTQVTWGSVMGPDKGKATLLIDGSSRGTYDLFNCCGTVAATNTFNVSSGSHTIQVRASGTKNSSSTGTFVTLDYFKVGSSVSQDSGSSSTKITFASLSAKTSSSASGGTYRLSKKSGATASLSFVGNEVDWITASGPANGKAEVFVDGVDEGTVDLYASSTHWKLSKPYFTSGSGQHTILVRVLGQKRSASSGTTVIVDAFNVTS